MRYRWEKSWIRGGDFYVECWCRRGDEIIFVVHQHVTYLFISRICFSRWCRAV